jgi:hypothetical protein
MDFPLFCGMLVTGISDHAVGVHSLQVAVTSRVARVSHRRKIADGETGTRIQAALLLRNRPMKTMGIL